MCFADFYVQDRRMTVALLADTQNAIPNVSTSSDADVAPHDDEIY
jgi:hypothetical protein